MAESYGKWSFRDLKTEVVLRRLNEESGPDIDLRKRDDLIRLLREDDLRQREAEEEAEFEAEAAKEPPRATELEQLLAEKVPKPAKIRVFEQGGNRNREEEALRVRNLPGDYLHGWASLSVPDDLGNWLSRGWIRVTEDMVTSDPTDTSKIFVASYDVYQGGYVRFKDCLLMVANRRLVEHRKRSRQKDWNEQHQKVYGSRDGVLTKDRVGDSSSRRQFRRSAQWGVEEMIEGGES